MPTLADNVARWLGRVELVARGVDDERREAERALEAADPLRARGHARALLARAPGSPIGLALLAESCEAAGLREEGAEALEALCRAAPWRAELWVKLAEARAALGAPAAHVSTCLLRALEPDADPRARRQALLRLADLDLAHGDPWRASRWVDALGLLEGGEDAALRRLEVALAMADREGARAAMRELGEPPVLDPRGSLATGRARMLLGEPAALELLLRSYVLEAPGAPAALASCVAATRDAVQVKRVREVLRAAGTDGEPHFALALALAEGRSEDARAMLERIAAAGDPTAPRALYDIAIERGDAEALGAAVGALGPAAPPAARAVADALEARASGEPARALDLLDAAVGTPVEHVASGLRVELVRALVATASGGVSNDGLAALRRAAASLERFDLAGACEAIAAERERPLRVAVVGEFNAGKSTFINALIGADVAPTGILPTTATLHWLAWAPDAFARIVVHGGADRVVQHGALKTALLEVERATGRPPRQVHIFAPIERLRRVEVLDTPGFNAPEADHVEAARRAVSEAHVVLWVFDAAQAMKESERAVLAAIAALGVPMQALVNKSDRVPPERLGVVLEHVRGGLEEAGLSTLGPVLGLSARLALRGRLGDEAARGASGWDAVEASLGELVVDRSEQLRARGIRRKARALAAQLLIAARARAQEERDRARAAIGAARASSEQAARLLALDRSACERVRARLEEAVRGVVDDWRPLRLSGVGAGAAPARAWGEARVVARLAEPLAAALLGEVGIDPAGVAVVRASVALVVRGASTALSEVTETTDVLGPRAIRACAAAAFEALARAPSEVAAPREGAVLASRLAAFEQALAEPA